MGDNLTAGAIFDLEANTKEAALLLTWPVRYKETEQWYNHVESFTGYKRFTRKTAAICLIAFLPPPMEMNCVEKMCSKNKKNITKAFAV